jgi:DNA-binding transcriptional regulator YiaG
LPSCYGCMVAPRPLHANRWKCTQTVPKAPKTIGDHIKAKRLALHLFQHDVAHLVRVHKVSVQDWERNLSTPNPSQMPAIIQFLGYVPFAHDGSASGRSRWLRLCAGWTQEELAVAVKCDEMTVWKWENGKPCDRRLWSRGVVCLQGRLQSLGLAGLTNAEIENVQSSPAMINYRTNYASLTIALRLAGDRPEVVRLSPKERP